MLTRITTRIARLTTGEQASLAKLCVASDCEIPGAHALRFLELGLAELACGALDPTGTTRIAMSHATAA